MSEHTKMCQAYIVREHMKLKCNDNHTISRQSEIKIEHKSFLHFPIIKNVTVQRNLIKISNKQNSSRLIQLIPRLGHAFIYALKQIWIQSPAAVPEKGQAMPFSLLWLIPAALWVSAAKQGAHKTQEKKYLPTCAEPQLNSIQQLKVAEKGKLASVTVSAVGGVSYEGDLPDSSASEQTRREQDELMPKHELFPNAATCAEPEGHRLQLVQLQVRQREQS